MVNARATGRLGILAAGLGIGAAIASAPGIAWADPASDSEAASAIVGSLLSPDALPAADPTANIAISIDGFTLLHDGSATAMSDAGDIAIAIGDGAHAEATGGFLDMAMADGVNSGAYAEDGDVLAAFANGTGSSADASDGDVDYATAFGDNTTAGADLGNFNAGSIFDPAGGGVAVAGEGNDNTAFVLGDSVAGAGGDDVGANVLGNNDFATVLGNGDTALSGATSISPGDFDLAGVFGNNLPIADATGANFLVDIMPAIGGIDSEVSTFLTEIGSFF